VKVLTGGNEDASRDDGSRHQELQKIASFDDPQPHSRDRGNRPSSGTAVEQHVRTQVGTRSDADGMTVVPFGTGHTAEHEHKGYVACPAATTTVAARTSSGAMSAPMRARWRAEQ
jgi:hypothetical protein